MKEITIKAFTFDELDEKVQRKLLQDYCDINVDSSWYEPIVEGFREDMESYGIIDAIPQFSGFWSQGDGACFVSNTVDTDMLIRNLYEEGYNIPEDGLLYSGDYSICIQKVEAGYAHRYDHENTVEAYVTLGDGSDRIDDYTRGKVEMIVTGWVRERSQALYRDLEKYYIELTSDKAIRETLSDEDNGYLFTRSGKLIELN
jgi:hypothetical protein